MRRQILALALASALLTLTACGGTASAPGGSTNTPGEGTSSSRPGGSTSTPGEGTSSSRPGGSAGNSSAGTIPELTLNSTEISLSAAGASFQLRYTTDPETDAVPVYLSSDEKVAAVDGTGTITAVAPGKATVTVECGGGSASANVTCDWQESGTSSAGEVTLTLNKTDVTLKSAGSAFQLKGTITPDIYDGLFVFTSSAPEIASVDESGTVTALAPGRATITAAYDRWTAECIVRCVWEETPAGGSGSPDGSGSSGSSGGDSSKPDTTPPDTAVQADLKKFYDDTTGKYPFSFMMEADDATLTNFFAGLSDLNLAQRVVYLCGMMPSPHGDFALVQVSDAADVDTVKSIFQSRIDYMVGDGNGPGGAFYPMEQTMWEENARIAVNGSYLLLIVHESCDDIVNEFNALF